MVPLKEPNSEETEPRRQPPKRDVSVPSILLDVRLEKIQLNLKNELTLPAEMRRSGWISHIIPNIIFILKLFAVSLSAFTQLKRF